MKQAVKFGQSVGREIGKAAIEMVLSEPIPSGISAIDDVKTIGKTLNPDFLPNTAPERQKNGSGGTPEDIVDNDDNPFDEFSRFFGRVGRMISGGGGKTSTESGGQSTSSLPSMKSIESLSTGAEGYLNASMPEDRKQSDGNSEGVVEPVDRFSAITDLREENSGFATLTTLAELEQSLGRQAISTADDSEARAILKVYRNSLDHHERIARRVKQRLNDETPPSGEYWENLHTYGLDLSKQMEGLSAAQKEAVDSSGLKI